MTSLKSALIVYFLFTALPQIGFASTLRCSEVFQVSKPKFDAAFSQALAHLKTPNELHLLNISFHTNKDGIRDALRRPSRERLENARSLSVPIEKFRSLTDAELRSQWEGESELNLPADLSKYKYLGPVENLRRGDIVKVTRTIEISKRDLEELLLLKVVTSNHIHILNYDLQSAETLNQKSGLKSLEEIIGFHINTSSSGAISTTYAVGGWKNTPADQPLLYNPHAKTFLLRLDFNIPVESIVSIKSIPDHVRKDPHGFAFFNPDASWRREHEITFYSIIPSAWVTTDFERIKKMMERI